MIERQALVTALMYWRHVQLMACESSLLTLENATVLNTHHVLTYKWWLCCLFVLILYGFGLTLLVCDEAKSVARCSENVWQVQGRNKSGH
jgi:hypothetical protein